MINGNIRCFEIEDLYFLNDLVDKINGNIRCFEIILKKVLMLLIY